MTSPEDARTTHELRMLEAMVDCAHGLGMRLGEAAKAERDAKSMLILVEAYGKCFQGVRMGIRLCQALRSPPKAAPARPEPAERPEAPERERLEIERPERPEPLERERDRDYEPVSLPKFLSTLGLAARSAERLGDALPAEAAAVLPTLKGLLAEARAAQPAPDPDPRPPTPGGTTPVRTAPDKSAPDKTALDKSTGLAVVTRPREPTTRRNLLGSAATPRPAPRGPPRWSG